MNDRYLALENFARGQAWCPCCDGVLGCLDECTYKEDSREDDSYQRMLAARLALTQRRSQMNNYDDHGAEMSELKRENAELIVMLESMVLAERKRLIEHMHNTNGACSVCMLFKRAKELVAKGGKQNENKII